MQDTDEQCEFCKSSGRFTELELVRWEGGREVLCCEGCQDRLGLCSVGVFMVLEGDGHP